MPDVGLVVATVVGGTLSAGSANALNCVYDRDIDEQMRRTRRRALPRHLVSPRAALVFGLVLGVVSTLMLGLLVNWLSAGLALAANVFYVVGYTMILKRRTTQNIVWGGAAGCFPALIGWTAVTGSLAWPPVVLFLVVFFWTPPHFWALALRYREDYAAAHVPMLPSVAPAAEVGRQIVVYSWVTVAVSLLLWPVASTGWFYPAAAVVLGAGVPHRGTPAAASYPDRGDRRRHAPDAALPLVEHVPLAALPRRRARPAADALSAQASRVRSVPGGFTSGNDEGIRRRARSLPGSPTAHGEPDVRQCP